MPPPDEAFGNFVKALATGGETISQDVARRTDQARDAANRVRPDHASHITRAPSEIEAFVCLFPQSGRRGTLYYAASLRDANLLQKLIDAGADDGSWVRLFPSFALPDQVVGARSQTGQRDQHNALSHDATFALFATRPVWDHGAATCRRMRRPRELESCRNGDAADQHDSACSQDGPLRQSARIFSGTYSAFPSQRPARS